MLLMGGLWSVYRDILFHAIIPIPSSCGLKWVFLGVVWLGIGRGPQKHVFFMILWDPEKHHFIIHVYTCIVCMYKIPITRRL